MLGPDYLRDLPEPVLALWRQAEEDILREMARRLQSMDYWVPSAQWQYEKLREAGRTEAEILRILSRYTGRTEAALRQLMQEAAAKALKSDAAIHEAAGKDVPDFRDSQVLRDKLTAGFLATRGTMRNLTRTTARTATGQFEAALDRAWMQVTSGAFSHQQAVLHAIDSLAKEGIDAIRYPSGHRDTIETAVRRAVVTGVNQTALRCQEALSDELDCDLVEVTAHEGARPSHAVWQGKIYSRSGESKKYPKLSDATGYGTGAGLGGWNCRHSFHPWYEGTPRTWTEEQLEKLKEKDITYDGEKLTEYEASQKQRYIERQLRRWKREYAAREAAGEDTGPAAAKIQAWNAKQKDFLNQTGLKRQSSREEAAGWTGRKATEASRQANENHRAWLKSIGADETTLKTLDNYYAGKYDNSPEYELLRGYAKAVDKGDISPLVGFDLYQEVDREITEKLIGQKTVTGLVIESRTTHFIDRVIGQTSTSHKDMRCGVAVDDVLHTLVSPVRLGNVRYLPDGDIRQTYHGEKSSVAVSIRDKRIIQTNPKG